MKREKRGKRGRPSRELGQGQRREGTVKYIAGKGTSLGFSWNIRGRGKEWFGVISFKPPGATGLGGGATIFSG